MHAGYVVRLLLPRERSTRLLLSVRVLSRRTRHAEPSPSARSAIQDASTFAALSSRCGERCIRDLRAIPRKLAPLGKPGGKPVEPADNERRRQPDSQASQPL